MLTLADDNASLHTTLLALVDQGKHRVQIQSQFGMDSHFQRLITIFAFIIQDYNELYDSTRKCLGNQFTLQGRTEIKSLIKIRNNQRTWEPFTKLKYFSESMNCDQNYFSTFCADCFGFFSDTLLSSSVLTEAEPRDQRKTLREKNDQSFSCPVASSFIPIVRTNISCHFFG